MRNIECKKIKIYIYIPSYIVQALGYKAWYVDLWPFKFQSQDPMPDGSISLGAYDNERADRHLLLNYLIQKSPNVDETGGHEPTYDIMW